MKVNKNLKCYFQSLTENLIKSYVKLTIELTVEIPCIESAKCWYLYNFQLIIKVIQFVFNFRKSFIIQLEEAAYKFIIPYLLNFCRKFDIKFLSKFALSPKNNNIYKNDSNRSST